MTHLIRVYYILESSSIDIIIYRVAVRDAIQKDRIDRETLVV